MILLRSVIFLALAGAGIWYFLAEPDRQAAFDAMEQDLTAEAEMRRQALTEGLQAQERAVTLIARSAPVATLLAEKPEPEPQRPAAQDTFDGNGFARPAPAPAAVPDERAEEQALEELKSLEALTGLDAISILKKGETDGLPPFNSRATAQAGRKWQAGIDTAFQGQSAQALYMAIGGDPVVMFFAPRFSDTDVPAIIIAEAGLGDVKSQWEASAYQLSLTDGNGSVILSNSVAASGEVIKITREVPYLDAAITVATAEPQPLGPWAVRSAAAGILAVLGLLLWEVNLSRRRLRSQLAEARRSVEARSEEVIVERAAVRGKGQNAQAGGLALLSEVSDAIGQEISRPLAAIRNHAKAAQRHLENDQPDGARENIRHVSNMAERMTRIVANMRGFEAAQPYRIEPVSIRPVVHDAAVAMLERDPALGDFFFMEVADDVAEKSFVRADKTRLSQVIDILLASSWDACRDQRQPELVISIQQTSADMVVAIDYGGRTTSGTGPDGQRIGADATADASAPVTGGVSYTIAKSILEAMGGRLGNRNSALGGDRIEIIIPKFRPNAA